MNNVIKLGLLLTAVSIISNLLFKYVIGLEYLFSWKAGLTSFVLSIIITVFLGRKLLRNPEEGRLGYGQAVKKLFIAFIISSFLGFVASVLLFGGDDQMKTEFQEYIVASQEWGAKLGVQIAGGSEAEQEAAVEMIREQIKSGEIPESPYPYSWSALPMSLISGAIGSILIALLLALFVKEPESGYPGALDA